jgi:hypothetical protein
MLLLVLVVLVLAMSATSAFAVTGNYAKVSYGKTTAVKGTYRGAWGSYPAEWYCFMKIYSGGKTRTYDAAFTPSNYSVYNGLYFAMPAALDAKLAADGALVKDHKAKEKRIDNGLLATGNGWIDGTRLTVLRKAKHRVLFMVRTATITYYFYDSAHKEYHVEGTQKVYHVSYVSFY